MAKEWCCTFFQTFFGTVGTRGVGIFFRRPDEPILQFRAAEPTDAPRVHKALSNCASPVALTLDLPVKYCPWCGRDIIRFYRRRVGKLLREDLAVPTGPSLIESG
jgi:hypothetical protein